MLKNVVMWGRAAALVAAAVWLMLAWNPHTASAGGAVRQGNLGATEFYVRVKGATQGVFQGSHNFGTQDNLIPGLGWTDESAIPIDPATGLPSGKRTHQPITITKKWDSATPQLVQALTTNETLTSVELIFFRTSTAGQEVVGHRVTLKNAHLVRFKEMVDTGETNGTTGKIQVEEWAFTYQSATFDDVTSAKTAIDTVTL